MTTFLPIDENSHPIPALRLKPGSAQAIAANTSTSSRNSTAFGADTKIVSLYASGNVYIRFGNSSVTAASTDHYYPSGIYYDFAIGGGRTAQYDHIAVLAADSSCTLYVSEKE